MSLLPQESFYPYGWFENDASFQSLVNDLAQPLLERAREDLVGTARGVLETVATTETAGAQVPTQVRQDLETVGVELGYELFDSKKDIDFRVASEIEAQLSGD